MKLEFFLLIQFFVFQVNTEWNGDLNEKCLTSSQTNYNRLSSNKHNTVYLAAAQGNSSMDI